MLKRIAQFFAQVKTEVGDELVGKEESLWYSVGALANTISRYFSHCPEEADNLGYKRISLTSYNALPSASKAGYTKQGGWAYSQIPKSDGIAKRVYCCNNAAGTFVCTIGGCEEGLEYKGKGFIQLTWKSNYKSVEDILKVKLPEESVDIVANPDQLLDTKIGLLSAMVFWEWQKPHLKVSNTTASTDKITAVVNLNTPSYAERRDNFTAIYQVLK
jgi:predicted chitinase